MTQVIDFNSRLKQKQEEKEIAELAKYTDGYFFYVYDWKILCGTGFLRKLVGVLLENRDVIQAFIQQGTLKESDDLANGLVDSLNDMGYSIHRGTNSLETLKAVMDFELPSGDTEGVKGLKMVAQFFYSVTSNMINDAQMMGEIIDNINSAKDVIDLFESKKGEELRPVVVLLSAIFILLDKESILNLLNNNFFAVDAETGTLEDLLEVIEIEKENSPMQLEGFKVTI